MTRKRFRCRKCGLQFEKDVFEPGEADYKRLPSGPVTCPKCNSVDVTQI